MQKYKKVIESIRLYGSITLGILIAIHWINSIVGLIIALVLGLIDHIVVVPKLKPTKEEKSDL